MGGPSTLLAHPGNPLFTGSRRSLGNSFVPPQLPRPSTLICACLRSPGELGKVCLEPSPPKSATALPPWSAHWDKGQCRWDRGFRQGPSRTGPRFPADSPPSSTGLHQEPPPTSPRAKASGLGRGFREAQSTGVSGLRPRHQSTIHSLTVLFQVCGFGLA